MSDTQDFLIGGVLTASEMEGVADAAEWRRWIEKERAPDSADGSGFRISWREDLQQLAELGVTELMVTLEWARIWPHRNEADHADQQEVEFRRDLLTEINELGITPWACLVDGTLPGWFAEDEGGFSDDHARNLIWPRHVDRVGETFGDLVGGWVPQREPIQWAMWSNLLGVTPPGKQRRRDALQVVKSSLEAELHAWRLLRGDQPVATFQTARTIHSEVDNVKAAPHGRWLDETFNELWLRSLSDGAARDAFDRVIVQLRPAICVDEEGDWSPHAVDHVVETELEAFNRVLESAGDRAVLAAGDLAGLPVDGDARSHHLRSLLEGVQAMGAHGWWQASPIDGWHWLGGFEEKPGLIDRARSERESAEVLRENSQLRPR